uniref:Transmembrane protein 214 n=1 Tax=Myripristis murdjan TaxID=586833 RepID=A0A667ZGL3_9TELE
MSETLFEGFEKAGKKQNKEQVPPPAEPQNKKPSSSKPSKKSNSSTAHTPTSHKNLEEAFKALDVGELKQQLARSQTLFPENPSVWVKDLAGYLNHKLTAPETEPTLSSYAHDYPYCLTGKELRGVIKGLIGRCSDTLPDFFDHCIYTMLRELDRQSGEPLHGYRVCIQAILQDKPRIATQNLAEYLELLRSVQNRPVKCLTIMWALGQAGFYDLSQGLRVWLGIMLPVLGVKSLSSYAISYLERLLLLHANLTKGFGIMGPKDFFPLLDFAFMPKNALSPSLQEQLRRLYPRLKVLAFGAKPESTLHTYLPSFLSRATPHCPDDMKRELLSSMTECLRVDVQSLGVWRQLYTKHLPQSRWLRKNLQETVQSFRVTNEEMRDSIDSKDLQECHVLCQNLQVKMRGQGFPWSRLLMALLVFAVGFVAHDIRSHGSFTGVSESHSLIPMTSQDSVQASQVLPHQTGSSMSSWTLLCALVCSHGGTGRGHLQTVPTKLFPQSWKHKVATVLLATAKPRLVHQIARRGSGIRHSREHVSTALESSGGVLYTTASDTLHCAWLCKAWMQLLGHGNPFHEALYALFLS